MYFFRRRYSGAREFNFRWRLPSNGYNRICVSSKDREFSRTVYLRQESSDIFNFEEIFCNNDYNLRRSVRYLEIESLYLSLSGSGVPLILDLGANIGLSSLYFCKNWPLAKIVALEPERRNLETLLLNIKGIPSIDAIHAAISSHDGTVRITNPDDDAWGYRTQETAEGGGRFHQGDVCRFCYRNHRHKGSPPIPVYRENRY